MDEVVELNVGGTYFTTTRSTLCKEPSSMLARMFAGDMTPSTKDKQGRYFIDRSGQHFGAVLSYLHGEKVDMLATRSLVEEAKYYQLEALWERSTASQGSSVLEKPSSLQHYCEKLRDSVGSDVIDAVEDALIRLWTCTASHSAFPTAPCSAVDQTNYKVQRHMRLYAKQTEFERPIDTSHWQGPVQLCLFKKPGDQISGADAANFMKVLYQCHGIIVKDLEEMGFDLALKSSDLGSICYGYDMATDISIRAMTKPSPFVEDKYSVQQAYS